MRFIHDPEATADEVLTEYAAAHYGAAASRMAEIEGRELEMVRNINFIDSHLTFHAFPLRPNLKYVKAGCIFGAFHENADLSMSRGSWSMLYWKKAPTHEHILAEKARGLAMAEEGLAAVRSLQSELPSDEYTRLSRAWENATKVARALQAFTKCIVAYFEEMEAGRDIPERLEAASAEAVSLIESMMDDVHPDVTVRRFYPATEKGCLDYAYFNGLRFYCRELLAEYRAERAVRRQLLDRNDIVDFVVPGGIYDDGRVLRPMHGAHSELVDGTPVRWVGNTVFPNGTIEVSLRDAPGAHLEIALAPSGSQEYACTETAENGFRKVVLAKKGAAYPGVISIALVR